jgi:hypothetical protein
VGLVKYHIGKESGHVPRTAVKRPSGKPQKLTCQIHVRDPEKPYLVGRCGELPRLGHFVVWEREFGDCKECLGEQEVHVDA